MTSISTGFARKSQMFVVEKHPLVDCGLEEAALWYAAREANLAERFIRAAEDAIRVLGREPSRCRVRFEDVRKLNLQGFPYGVFYFISGEVVHVRAVLHAARDHRAVLKPRSLSP